MAEILRAKAEHAEAIHRIARRLQLEGRELTAAVKSGFFLYAGSVTDYQKTLRESDFCYIAREAQECIGFLTTITPEALAKLPAGPNRDLFEENGEFPLLIEQIGVTPEWQHRGVGQSLIEELLEKSKTTRLMATVVHSPVRNEGSIQFLLRNQWRLHREVTTVKRVWGFYEYRQGRHA